MSRESAIEAERNGQLALAARLYDSCRPPADALPDERYKWANGRAILAERLGEADLATTLYDEVVALFPQLREPHDGSIYGLSNAAAWSAGFGERARTGLILKRLRAAAERQDWRGISYEPHMIEAVLAAAAGELAVAELHWGEASESARRAGETQALASIAEERATLLVALGRRGEAIDLLRAHVSGGEGTFGDLRVLPPAIALGALLAEGDDTAVAEASRLLRRALVTEAGRGMPEAEWRIMAALAEVAARRDRTDSAITLGKLAVRMIAELDRLPLGHPARVSADIALRLRPHRRLVARLVEAARFPEAAHVQRLMQQEVVDGLAWHEAGVANRSPTIPLTAPEEAACNAYSALRAAFVAKELAVPGSPAPDTVLERDVGAWIDAMLAPQAGGRVRMSIPAQGIGFPGPGPDDAELHFLQGDAGLRVYVRSSHGEMSFDIAGSSATLAHDVFALRESLRRIDDGWRPPSARLYDLVVRPIEPLLAGVKHVGIGGLDGPLAYLPFAALHDGKRFLAERVAFSVGTGIDARDRPAPSRERWRLRLLGSAGDLAHVGNELQAIDAATTAARRIEPFSADVLGRVLAEGVEAVHLAGHFHLEPARPDRSFLALDGGGKLMLTQWRQLDFSSVELLALSSCETAVGERGPLGAASLAGLARAAGARAVLATLWAVADVGAAHIMPAFYRKALESDRAPPLAEALRAAQIALLGGESGTQLMHPGYWAGFVLHE